MDSLTVAYLAGLLDGEGSFLLARLSNGVYAAWLSLGMTDRAAVDVFADATGKKVHLESRNDFGNRQPVWTCKVSEKGLLIVILTKLLPHLRAKRLQAQLLLEFLTEFPGNGNKAYTQEQLDRQGMYAMVLRGLNARGPGSAELKDKLRSVL